MLQKCDVIHNHWFIYNDESFSEILTIEQQHLIFQYTNYKTISELIYDVIINNGCVFISSLDYIEYINGYNVEAISSLLPKNVDIDKKSVYLINKLDLHYLINDLYVPISFNLYTDGFKQVIITDGFYDIIMNKSYSKLTIEEIDILYTFVVECIVKIMSQIVSFINSDDCSEFNKEYAIVFITYNKGSIMFSIFY